MLLLHVQINRRRKINPAKENTPKENREKKHGNAEFLMCFLLYCVGRIDSLWFSLLWPKRKPKTKHKQTKFDEKKFVEFYFYFRVKFKGISFHSWYFVRCQVGFCLVVLLLLYIYFVFISFSQSFTLRMRNAIYFNTVGTDESEYKRFLS